MWSETIRYSRLFSRPVALQLNEQALAQVARADAGRIKALDEREHELEILLRDAGIHRHLFRRGLEEAVVVDVADDEFGGLAIVAAQRGLIQLPDEMLLQRFLGGDGIEKELALFLVLLRAAAVAARLRHVIAPFVVEFRQLIEFLLEILFRRLALGDLALLFGRLGQFLEDGIGLHFLLHEVAQLEEGRLENEQALLELRREDLLQGKILRLIHSRAGHGQRVSTELPTASSFRAVRTGRSASRTRSAGRGNVTCFSMPVDKFAYEKTDASRRARSFRHLHRRAIARVGRPKGVGSPV